MFWLKTENQIQKKTKTAISKNRAENGQRKNGKTENANVRFFCQRRRSLGSLSKYVSEPRTATGSRMFPFLARFCSSQRKGKALVGRLWLDVTNVMASKRLKRKKSTSGCRPWLKNVCA